MHIGRHIVQEIVLELGKPAVERWDVRLSEDEHRLFARRLDAGRAHDVTLLIVSAEPSGAGDAVAVVREQEHPEGVWCLPSGAIDPEESFLDGARREAFAATGLSVSIDRYLLQMHLDLRAPGRPELKWTTHVLVAHPTGGEIGPGDRAEVQAARWASWDELTERIHPVLQASGSGRLEYRARLQARIRELAGRRAELVP